MSIPPFIEKEIEASRDYVKCLRTHIQSQSEHSNLDGLIPKSSSCFDTSSMTQDLSRNHVKPQFPYLHHEDNQIYLIRLLENTFSGDHPLKAANHGRFTL